ncbi:AfsR/SARP family transcriptional regulator, partial [Allorhizocola rhizosphaerae]|uniref:AfsR/SARP family transcriptional regulator n=1 Tax=Allorhizocola rhizosphaerae TaxID=1872709 RepID=UPI001B8BCFE5
MSTRSENTPFQILGPLRINGAPVREMITQTKPRQLIATLLIHANHFVSTEVLTDALWEGRPPKSAGANLRTYMRVLRDCLETTAAPGQIVTLPGGYRMMVSPDNLDVTLAESLSAEGRHLVGSGDRAGGLAILDRACELWQGQPLEDLPICSTWRAWLNRIEQRRTELLHDVLPLHIACGSHRRAVALARDALGRDPLSEDLWCHVIEGLHAAGQPAEARRAFEECRQLLAAELGVEPGAK